MSNLTKSIAILGVVAGLGVAALPLSTYADAPSPATADVPVALTIEEILEISADNEGDVELTKAGATGLTTAEYAGKVTVNVKTNHTAGYWLGIMGSTDTAGLKSGAVATDLGNATDLIHAGTLQTGTSAWAWQGGDVTSWTAATTENVLVYQGTQDNNSLDTKGGHDTEVTFGATIAKDQAAGTYKGKVTFTATAGLKSAA